MDRQGVFATPGKDMSDILDFLEDMILMTGCPECSSINTKIMTVDNARILICMDCGCNEELPPAS